MTRLLIVLSVVLAIMGMAFWALKGHESPRPIRIGINPWPGYEPMFLARARGLFAAHGLDVQLVEFSSVGDCLHGYQQGDVDGLCATLVEVEMARRHGRQGTPQIVIIPDTSNGADVILAQQPINSMKDLRGKRIGVEPAGLGVFILTRALALNQMAIADVKLVSAGQEDMAKAFTSGQVDAVVTYSPYSFDITKAGGVKIFSTAEIPGEVVDVIVLSPEKATDAVTAQLRAVWSDVMEIIAREPEASIAAMAKRQQITPEEFKLSMEGIKLMQMQDQERLLMPGGSVEKSQVLIREIFAHDHPVDVH
jgi:NitT/TauT family transport system substrate-binding protein